MVSTTRYEPPVPPFERDAAFRDLSQALRGARPPLALVGAGASVASGYPNWLQLLQALQGSAKRQGSSRAWRRQVVDLNDAPWTAEVFARELKPGGLGRLIRARFRSRGTLVEPHLTLGRMPFPHVLTTNYDPCIEEALAAAGRPHDVVTWSDAAALSSFLIGLSNPQAKPCVVYLHGRYDSPQADIVLTESSYVARYIASDDARRKLMAIFMTHPVMFVGFSMNDPDLANLMREVTARLKTDQPCHFAIMSYKTLDEREATRDRMERKFGVRPVFYSRIPPEQGGDEHANLVLLLDALMGESRRREATEHTPAPVAFDPEDPNKGRFGGCPLANERLLRVVRTGGSEDEGYLDLQFVVEATRKGAPVEGKVTFHLHPTFPREAVTVGARGGRAVLDRWAYGAFTVGVEADEGRTRLELDLATEPSLPLWFRRR